MKYRNLIIIILLIGFFGSAILLVNSGKKQPVKEDQKITQKKIISVMKLTSTAFSHNQSLPDKYSCKGAGINPPLTFNDIPVSAKSLVLTLTDPDAPIGTFIHWLIWNIDPKTSEIAENSIPPNTIQGKNTTGSTSFIAPCPPSGTHHYIFTLYALDTVLSLPSSTDKTGLDKAMEGHILDRAELIGLYK